MAERRMLSKSFLGSDQFHDLPLDHQALYFHLCLNADDDGFLSNAKSITRTLGLSLDTLTVMEEAGYLILFGSGVTVIRHWRIHNAIRKDRYNPTPHQREFNQLTVDNEGTYQLIEGQQVPMETSGCQAGNQSATQVSVGKFISGQDRRESSAPAPEEIADSPITDGTACQDDDHPAFGTPSETCSPACSSSPMQRGANCHDQEYPAVEVHTEAPISTCSANAPTRDDVRCFARQRSSKVDPDRFYDYYSARNWMRGSSPILNWQAAFRCWENREKDFSPSAPFKKEKLLPIQQYSQRDYSGQEETMDEMMERLMAG